MKFPMHDVPVHYFTFNNIERKQQHKFSVSYGEDQSIEHWDRIMDDLINSFGPPGNDQRWMYSSTFSTMTFYFKDPEDLMLARLKVDYQ